jgi:hypothetical protein
MRRLGATPRLGDAAMRRLGDDDDDDDVDDVDDDVMVVTSGATRMSRGQPRRPPRKRPRRRGSTPQRPPALRRRPFRDSAIRRLDDSAIRRLGDSATARLGDSATRRLGDFRFEKLGAPAKAARMVEVVEPGAPVGTTQGLPPPRPVFMEPDEWPALGPHAVERGKPRPAPPDPEPDQRRRIHKRGVAEATAEAAAVKLADDGVEETTPSQATSQRSRVKWPTGSDPDQHPYGPDAAYVWIPKYNQWYCRMCPGRKGSGRFGKYCGPVHLASEEHQQRAAYDMMSGTQYWTDNSTAPTYDFTRSASAVDIRKQGADSPSPADLKANVDGESDDSLDSWARVFTGMVRAEPYSAANLLGFAEVQEVATPFPAAAPSAASAIETETRPAEVAGGWAGSPVDRGRSDEATPPSLRAAAGSGGGERAPSRPRRCVFCDDPPCADDNRFGYLCHSHHMANVTTYGCGPRTWDRVAAEAEAHKAREAHSAGIPKAAPLDATSPYGILISNLQLE